jgi:hypothetical protein
MIELVHSNVAVMTPRQMEVAVIKKRLDAHWVNITSIIPDANKDVVLEQVVTIAHHYTDRASQREIVKCLNVIAARLHQSAAAFDALDALDPIEQRALLTRAGADPQLSSVLRKVCGKAHQSASTIDVKRSVSGRRQRERAAKKAAAAAAVHMLRQAYPERVITVALQVELSEILFEVATGRDATNMRNICALVNQRR